MFDVFTLFPQTLYVQKFTWSVSEDRWFLNCFVVLSLPPNSWFAGFYAQFRIATGENQ